MTRYIVGVDGSGPSEAALKWAIRRAAAVPGPILLVHVIDDEWGMAGSDYGREAMIAGQQTLQRASERALVLSTPSRSASALNTAVQTSSRILHGSPVGELTSLCEPGDLLVVGTHKTGFLHGRVLGSRSVSIAAMAPCSVVIVPDSVSSTRHGIVTGVAGTDAAFAGVAQAAREADRLHESLIVIHSAPTSSSGGAAAESARHEQRRLLRAAVQAATQVAQHIDITTRVSARQPAEALLDASRDATMLVLEPSRTTDQRSILGSTTHDVLMNINAPVLVARKPLA